MTMIKCILSMCYGTSVFTTSQGDSGLHLVISKRTRRLQNCSAAQLCALGLFLLYPTSREFVSE